MGLQLVCEESEREARVDYCVHDDNDDNERIIAREQVMSQAVRTLVGLL